MLLLSLLELAFGQLFFNHMRASVRAPVWDCSCYLMATIVIAFKLLSSHASLVLATAGLWHLSVYLWDCSCYLIEAIGITLKLRSSHAVQAPL